MKKWIVLTVSEPLPVNPGVTTGPFYAAGSKWYTRGWGKNSEKNKLHVLKQANYLRELGFSCLVTEEMR